MHVFNKFNCLATAPSPSEVISQPSDGEKITLHTDVCLMLVGSEQGAYAFRVLIEVRVSLVKTWRRMSFCEKS